MKKLVFYSHDTYGLGNIRRTISICQSLISSIPDLSILIISGSPMIQSFRIPEGIDYVKLPCLTRSERDGYSAKFLNDGSDLGATYIARKLFMEPYLTLGYAFGSGDAHPKDGVDRNFRQTGFQTNSGKFGGVVNFDYYGVLFDPELSNLQIYTVGVGFRPLPKSSIDFVYHKYIQDHPFDEIRDASLDTDPRGKNDDIGQEIDAIFGYREIKNFRLRLRAGYFIPGKAFRTGRDDPAFLTKFDVQYSF